eukprot:m.83667 g.83667  ORF g.83667 m.83667 type:complete len:390 (+) comp14355_c0_seq5:185-1354(+)
MKRTAHHVSVPSSALRRGADATGKRKTLRGNTKTILLYGGGISLFVLFIFAIFYHHHSQGFAHFDRSTASGKVMALQDEQLIRLASKTSMRHFRNDLLKPFLVPRPVGSTNLRNVRKHIVSTLESLGWHVALDSFSESTPYGEKRFHNIIATWDTTAPQRVIFAAHYESKYFPSGPHKNFIGATDSAVPCAILLDLAETLTPSLKQRKTALGTTIQLVFFDGEEAFKEWTATDSLYGARHLAQKWAETKVVSSKARKAKTMLETIESLVLLDLLGAPRPLMHSAFPNTRHLHQQMATLEARLMELNLLTPQPASFFNTNYHARAPQVEDDHIPFLQRGVPVLHLISVPFPKAWHTAADNEQNLDFSTVENWLAIIRTFAAQYLLMEDII